MAYGNWGAFVFRAGERMKSHEDNTPFFESEASSGYWQAFVHGHSSQDVGDLLPGHASVQQEPRTPFTHRRSDFRINPHHAVLGDRAVRFCGYKAHPVLLVGAPEGDGEVTQVEMKDFATRVENRWDDRPPNPEYDAVEWAGQVEAHDGVYRFAAEYEDEDRMNIIHLALVEPDGTRWTSRCGIYIGAGYQDDDEARDVVDLLSEEAAGHGG